MVRDRKKTQSMSKTAEGSFTVGLQCQKLILYSKPLLLIAVPGDGGAPDQLYGFLGLGVPDEIMFPTSN